MPLQGEKKKAYQREWIRKRRQAWIESQGSICANCGETNKPFELDHIDPKTKVSHNIWSWSAERREAELAKCQLLCEDCHMDKSIQELTVEYSHGEYRMYHDKGCRCQPCTASVAPYWREYRARKKASSE